MLRFHLPTSQLGFYVAFLKEFCWALRLGCLKTLAHLLVSWKYYRHFGVQMLSRIKDTISSEKWVFLSSTSFTSYLLPPFPPWLPKLLLNLIQSEMTFSLWTKIHSKSKADLKDFSWKRILPTSLHWIFLVKSVWGWLPLAVLVQNTSGNDFLKSLSWIPKTRTPYGFETLIPG